MIEQNPISVAEMVTFLSFVTFYSRTGDKITKKIILQKSDVLYILYNPWKQ